MNLMKYIQIGNYKFANGAAALVDSLFESGGTASGIFRKRQHSVLFRKANGEPWFCLVANPGQSRFFVSAFKLEDGKTRYAFALSSVDANQLGFDRLTYSALNEVADTVWQTLNPAS